MGWVIDDPGAEKQAFDIIAAVKLDHQSADLLRGECSAGQIVVAVILAIAAVVYAVIGHEYFQQGNTAAVTGKAVTDTCRDRIPYAVSPATAVNTAGRTCYIIFGSIRKDRQFFHEI